MDTFTPEIEHDTLVYIPYSIEHLNGTPYKVYYFEMENKKGLQFIQRKKLPSEHIYRGVLNWKKKSYLFYEINDPDREFLETEKDDLWKVTPYEILYPQKVGEEKITPECTDLFKAHPELCYIDDHEVPVIAYLGIGVSEIKEQILLQTINERNGIFGQGYYFTDYENAVYDSYYKEQSDDFLIRLENKEHYSDKDIRDSSVYIRDNGFYHQSLFLGEVPSCNPKIEYYIYYYDEDVIYIKSTKPNHCKKQVSLRSEDGYVMRYILFLKRHFNHTHKKLEGDSYAYDSQYMVKNADDFICLSYHLIKKK